MPEKDPRPLRLALVGNANSGKTTLFNQLTGAKQKTGNWPGVTVEKRSGLVLLDEPLELVDLPGIYSLDHADSSPDEQVAKQFLLQDKPDLLINVLDASNLERSLFLTSQLIEFDIPVVIALNMTDAALKKGMQVCPEDLSKKLNLPVVPLIARLGEGIQDLKKQITQSLAHPAQLTPIQYQAEVESGLATEFSNRFQAIEQKLNQSESAEKAALEDQIAEHRFEFAHQTSLACMQKPARTPITNSDKIDRWILHPWLGIPLFGLMMYLIFFFTIRLSGAFIDFFDIAFGAIFVDGFSQLLSAINSPKWISLLLAQGVGSGIQTVATFIPVIGFLYFFLSFLEDSGYMARAAFVVNRLMSRMGLSGKAFVPLIVGLGCNVPSIMATRTLSRDRERITTIMMAPFISCGARLSVYALFVSIFFPNDGENIVFALYLVGILAAIATGLLLKHTLLSGEAEPLIMELPSYHLPALRTLFLTTWGRLKSFLFGAGKIIILMVMVIQLLSAIDTQGKIHESATPDSLLNYSAKALTPVFSPFGIEEDNWPATVGILTGILAKEVVVGTLDALYNQLESQETEAEAEPISTQLKQAFFSIPENLKDAMVNWDDPLDLAQIQSDADPEVSDHTIRSIEKRFDGRVGVFAYLLFILLYFPCASATAAIHKEAGLKWSLIAVFWTTALGYIVATWFYQAWYFAQNPVMASAWFAGGLLFFIIIWLILKKYGQRLGNSTA